MIHPYQWSVKLENGEIFVCQADSVDDLALAIQEVKSKLLNKTPVVNPPVQPKIVCSTCGGPAEIKEGISKKGNAYKVKKCLTDDSHSHFIK